MRINRYLLFLFVIELTIQTGIGFEIDLQALGSAISIPLISSGSSTQSSTTLNAEEGDFGDLHAEVCMDELLESSFAITDDFRDPIYRPINIVPWDREKISTNFVLYSNRFPSGVVIEQNATLLKNAGFNPKLQTKIIIHGWVENVTHAWVTEMSQLLVATGIYNVFAVDWGDRALYVQATANSRVVGVEVACFIRFLKDALNVDASTIHLIGHCLGCHVAGYAGERIDGLGRITGLDPSALYFQYMPKAVRLDPSDAKFVDVIHTDGNSINHFGYGMQQPCGHIDFYPNNGREQPGCPKTEMPLELPNLLAHDEGQKKIVTCNHRRAIRYFLESITSTNCQYVGHLCFDYASYKEGLCDSCGEDGSSCANMGLDADRFHGESRPGMPLKFYLTIELDHECSGESNVSAEQQLSGT